MTQNTLFFINQMTKNTLFYYFYGDGQKSSHKCLDNMILGDGRWENIKRNIAPWLDSQKFQNIPMLLNDHPTLMQKVVGEACFPLFIGRSPFHMDERPSSAHHHQEADSASELQRSFASGANHSQRTRGNHVNCQISILGNSSKNST